MAIAEVISIGDELTTGQRLDTNSQWLSQQLGDLGHRVMYHTTVADDLAANVAVFRAARERADLVVATGGLGPTADDLTRDAVAQTAGVELEFDQVSFDHIAALFARRQRPMPPANRVQALFPRGARIIPNPHGTAPGIDLDLPRSGRGPCRVFCLPGVPAEMKEMWFGTVAPALELAAGPERRIWRHYALKCFGVGESDLEQMLPDIIRRGRDPQVGITASQAMLTLRISVTGRDDAECRAAAQPTIDTIRQCLGTLLVSEQDEDLHEVVARLLTERRQTLATVECATPGLLAAWLQSLPGPAEWRTGNASLPRTSAPSLWRTADWDSLDVGQRTVTLARRARAEFGADFGLAIGPLPTDRPAGSPPPDVSIAIVGPSGERLHTIAHAGHPDIVAARTAKHALNYLRLSLI